MEILKNIVLVIVSPKVGWDEVKHSCITTGRLLSSTFLPMLVVLAVTSFVPMVYDVSLTLVESLMTAIIKFSSYLVTFHFTAYLLGSIYPELVQSQGGVDRMNDYIIYNLIFLILLEIIKNLLPVDFAPIFFMMFYMPFIAYKGVDYLGVKKSKQTSFSIVAGLLMLFMPQGLVWLLGVFIK